MKRHIPALLIASTLLLICGCRQNHQEAFSESTAAVPVPAHPATPQDTLSSVDEAVPSSLADVRPPDVKVRVRRGNALLLETEGLLLTAADTAVIRTATYSATALYEGEFPGLPQGMVNMTAAAAAYRLLPSGDHFRPAAELRVAYDPDRLPMGYTPDDIYTSYYDSAAHAWVRLDRIAVDTANREIVSLTSHFTDFVNELLKAPEMPETQAFVPTAMTDLEAVNPLDGLTLIQPPTANNSGTANLSYPLAIPAGRNGMQPNLALTYNSGGGSGWLGVGWDIPVPAITLDTRWGVPRYNDSLETEIYLLNGEQLITKDSSGEPHKMPHRTNQQTSRLRDGTQFYARFGDAHDSIIRHGDNPRNYWWEVVDRNGVTHYYGRYFQPERSLDIRTDYPVFPNYLPAGVTFNANDNILHWPLPTTLRDDKGNIARWVLTESRDLYGNTIRYYYDQATVRNRGAEGRQIYLDSISYTGHNDTDGCYTVVFCRTGNSTPDVPISCNNGFKEITDQLLNNVYLKYGDSIQTIWHFELENGGSTNYKNRLASITKIDSVGDMGMRALLDTFCHCIRQDEDEYATAGTDAPYIFIPTGDTLIWDTVYGTKDYLICAKPGLARNDFTYPPVDCSTSEIYDFVLNHLYYSKYDFFDTALLNTLCDSVYRGSPLVGFGCSHSRVQLKCTGYGLRVDSVRVPIFDSPTVPHHIRPLKSLETLKYVGTTTKFEYYNAPVSDSLFGPEKTINIPIDDNQKLHGFFLSDPENDQPATQLRSRATGLGLSTTSAWNVGGAATVGLGPVVCLTSSSLGGNYTRSGSSSETQMTLIDLDGDGLNDKVYVRDNKVFFCRQHWNESDSSFFFDSAEVVRGIHHIMRSSSRSNTFGVQAALGASASASWTNTTSTTSTYFADVNGDGFVDLVDDGQVYFNHCENGGVPEFKPYSTMPATPQDGDGATATTDMVSTNNVCGDIIFDGAANDSINCRRIWVLINTFTDSLQNREMYARLNKQMKDTMYSASVKNELLKVEVYHREWDCSYHDESLATDAVRVWIAPRAGEIDITSRIQLLEDTTPSRSVARHADGVVLAIQKTSNISYGHSSFNANSTINMLNSIMIDSMDYEMHVDSARRVSVDTGDMIFFRLRSKADYHFDNVYARFTIDYTDSNSSNEYSIEERHKWHFDSQEDFVLSSDGYFQAPVGGSYKIEIRQLENPENASVELRVNDNPVVWDWNNNNMYKTDDISKDVTISVVLTSYDPDIKWGDVVCKPHITFFPDPNAELYDTIDEDAANMTIDTIECWLAPQVKLDHAYSIYNTPLYRRLFGPLNKGWGQFAYRSEGAGADTIHIEKLLPPDMMLSDNTNVDDSVRLGQMTSEEPDTASFGQSETMEDFLESNPVFYSPYSDSSNWVEMSPDVEHWAWVGYGHQNTVGRDTISNSLRTDWYATTPDEAVYAQNNEVSITGQTNVYDDPVPPASQDGTPAKAVNKMNRSSSRSWSAGFCGAGISDSKGDNTIETEYMDLNGDRYPDIIGTDMVQYSQQWGGVGPVTELSSALSHGSTSHTWSRGISYSASQVTQERTSCSLQQNAFFTMHSEGSGSVSGGGNIGNDRAGGSWVDINGDGLPDFVDSNGHVRLNIGYDFIDDQTWNFKNVRSGVSGAISVNAGLSDMQEETETDFLKGVTNISQASIEAGVGVDGSYNQTTHMLMDINGDGLPDKLWREMNKIDSIVNGGDFVKTEVRYNLGAGKFSDPQTLGIGRFHSSVSLNESLNAGFTYGFTVWGFKVTAGINGCPYSAGVTKDYVQLADINADGLPDWVCSVKEDEITVRYNMGGKTNLLRSATNFTGSAITLDYTLSEATYDQPSRHWQLTSVATRDPLNLNGGDSSLTRFTYAAPYYNRYERTSLGYGTVTTSQIDTRNGSTYRIIERNYNNRDMMKRGKLTREMTSDGNNNPYIERLYDHTYLTLDGDTLDPCEPKTYTAHEGTITRYYEGQRPAKLVTEERFVYDRYHNVIRYYDLGDTAYNDDGLKVDIFYHRGQSHNLIGLRSEYKVYSITDTTTVTRRATFAYNDEGKLTRQTLYDGTVPSTYDFEYDNVYGNLSKATLPRNGSNQRMHYAYTYDPVVHTYPARIDNAYGEHSTTTYDYRFGRPLSVTDPAGATMRYTYDFAGRLTSVRSPLNCSAQPSLVNRYHPIHYYHRLLPFGNPVNPLPGGHPYSVTVHFDDHGDTVTETAVICDGFGRVIQTKKGLTVEGVPMMQVSGRAVADAFGRTVEQYDPVVESSSTHRGEYNTNYDVNTLTSTTYDILDRTKDVAMPLGVTTHTAYSIGNDLSGRRRFKTIVLDPNGNRTTQYSDYAGRQVQVTDALGGTTRFQYDNLGQLTRSTDPEGFHTHYAYDNLGRLIQRSHPDAGTTAYAYDPAGNITKQITPLGEIIFDYTYYRLAHKRYSDMDGNNVTYTYHLGGRISDILDGTGHRKLGYDALGNLVHEDRYVAIPDSDNALAFHTAYTYDSWGRMRSMTYPDGEQVDYTYRWGGDLFSVHGAKGADSYRYVDSIAYNALGQRAYIRYGNGTSATYAYDSLHRLTQLRCYESLGNKMQEIEYAFDQAGNITDINNTAGAIGPLGGNYANRYRYDALHRLATADADDLRFIQKYHITPAGRPATTQQHLFGDEAMKYYAYNRYHQPHAPRRIYVESIRPELHDLRWDQAGNLGQVSTRDEHSGDVRSRFLYWTEDNRLHTVVDDRYHSYYAYDHAGERTLKIAGPCDALDVSAWVMHSHSPLQKFTLYPSPYVVVSDHGYTKHYYAGTERLAARVGGGFGKAVLHEQQEGLTRQARDLFHQSLGSIQARRPLAAPGIHREKHLEDAVFSRMASHISVPENLEAHVEIWNRDFLQSMRDLVSDAPEPDVYFYHSDHLGSASWITDANGEAVQHLQYLPYGEPYVNQRAAGSTYRERFTFTGKERDEETGYGYFGARYMDYELMTMWLSVDPLADKYPSISPYNYCMWNPIKLIDPDGREVINRHTKNIENLKKEIADLEDQIKTCTGSKLERLNRKLVNKQKSLKEEMEYEKIVGNAIQDLKDYGGDEFEKLDQLTDIKGNKVDVYIQMEGYIEKIGGPEGKTYGTIHPDGSCSSEMGENTMLVSLSHKYRDVAGKVLAHEGGHVLFDVKLPHVLNGFYSSHPSAKRNGHDQDNPSGKWANAYENRYEENRRRAIK